MTVPLAGISFVIPVHNGERHLDAAIASVLAQADGRPMEVIAVLDGGVDRSKQILSDYAARGLLRVVDGPRQGAAAALNEGLRHAVHPIVCQVDQDVVLKPGWMRCLADALADPAVGAAQGYYETVPGGTIWARVMGLDLEDRYRLLGRGDVDHVCTGNSAYRADALRAAGLFDVTLGYGYDNDLSYRLVQAGYRLVIRPEARSLHYWRDGAWTYMVQQYGFGYGRLDLVAKHRHRAGGDDVSRLVMMLHAPLMAVALGLGLLSGVLLLTGGPARLPATAAAGIIALLAVERFVAGLRVAVRFRTLDGLWFAPVHLVRDLAWAAAIVVWCIRRVRGVTPRPADSMRPRGVARPLSDRSTP